MKKPRIDDFQPGAQPPKLSSSMDDMPAIATQPMASPQTISGAVHKEPSVRQSEVGRSDVSTPETPPVRPYGRTGARRVITRYAFEFYQDQIEHLRRRALEQKLQGEDGSMSEMVRSALDAFLSGEEGTSR